MLGFGLIVHMLRRFISRVRYWILRYLHSRAKKRYPYIGGGNVLRLTSGLVLKQVPPYRSRVEAEAIRFVSQHTSLPVPRLHMYWEESTIGYLIIDYAEGETLQRAWKKLSDAQDVRRSLRLAPIPAPKTPKPPKRQAVPSRAQAAPPKRRKSNKHR